MDIGGSVTLVLALAVLGGLLSSGIARKLNGPQVLGYILAGVILGTQGLNLISTEIVTDLDPLSFIALGIIGFLVGGEIEIGELRRYARKFSIILFAEGMVTAIFVTGMVFLVVWWALGDPLYAVIIAIVLGGISSATDPASTVGVIWENRAAGILTTTLTAIVAMDDVLAMALYGVASNVAQNLGGSKTTVFTGVMHFLHDIGGAVMLGMVVGGGIVLYLRRRGHSGNNLFVVLGSVLLTVGLAEILEVDLILASMGAGFIAANATPSHMKPIRGHLRELSVPIYILFFVLVGARLSFTGMPLWLWGVVAAYVIGRSSGKILGAAFGARLSKSDPSVVKFTGAGLLSQGGVAIGLAIVSGKHLQNIMINDSMSLGDAIITVVTATTFIIQLIGPVSVKWALKRAGETNRVLTSEDALTSREVGSMITTAETCTYDTPVEEVFEILNRNPSLETIAVLDAEGRVYGEITLSHLRTLIVDREVWSFLIAEDIMSHTVQKIYLHDNLHKAMRTMENLSVEQLLVTVDEDFKGYLLRQDIRTFVRDKTVAHTQVSA